MSLFLGQLVTVALTTDLVRNDRYTQLSTDRYLELQQILQANNITDIGELVGIPLWKLVALKSMNDELAQRVYCLLLGINKVEQACDDLFDKNISIITIDDEFYPQSLKLKLKDKAPVVFFATGNLRLLNMPSIAVTGSRNASNKANKFAFDIGKTISEDRKVLVTGGAEGCDFAATKSAINSGGYAVWYLARPLYKEISANKLIGNWLMASKICLISDYNPFGEFTGKLALQRNKYIYSNSQAAFVCECKGKISGTYSGANYCLKNKLTKLYVFANGSLGNEYLIKNGATPIIEEIKKQL